MKFKIDEKADQLGKLKKMYNTPTLTLEERVVLHNVMKDISNGQISFDSSDTGWEKIFDFVFKTEISRKQEIIQHYKKILNF